MLNVFLSVSLRQLEEYLTVFNKNNIHYLRTTNYSNTRVMWLLFLRGNIYIFLALFLLQFLRIIVIVKDSFTWHNLRCKYRTDFTNINTSYNGLLFIKITFKSIICQQQLKRPSSTNLIISLYNTVLYYSVTTT